MLLRKELSSQADLSFRMIETEGKKKAAKSGRSKKARRKGARTKIASMDPGVTPLNCVIPEL
jgi:hypothetical protein